MTYFLRTAAYIFSMDIFASFFAVIMLGTGMLLSCRLGFFQISHLGEAIRTALGFSGSGSGLKKRRESGGVSPFQALSTALGGSIGTANIAGVAGAIALGGPGAVFWMWAAAFLGMGIKYCEIVLTIKYRKKAGDSWSGGPMLYMENGLSGRGPLLRCFSRPIAIAFAIFGALSALVGTTLVQSNTIAMSMLDTVRIYDADINESIVLALAGVLTAVLAGIVILGGASRVGRASEIIVPFMAAAYIGVCMAVLFKFRTKIPEAFSSIIKGAFGARQLAGGAAGFGFIRAFRIGTARGVYSNEAGIGSAPMVYAKASESDPVKQGLYGIFEVFADTIVMCTMTALVVLTSGIDVPYGNAGISGTRIALSAFSVIMPVKYAGLFLTASMLLFAYTSILGWSVYGMQCTEYLLGKRAVKPFCILYCVLLAAGALTRVDIAWRLGETLNYLMAAPNLIAVVLLANEVKKLTREHIQWSRPMSRSRFNGMNAFSRLKKRQR